MYWRGYDLTYNSDDMSFAALRAVSEAPGPVLTFCIETDAIASADVKPSVLKQEYIESDTAVAASVYPEVVSDQLYNYFSASDLILPEAEAFYFELGPAAQDAVLVGVYTDSTAIVLSKTLLKHMADTGWQAASIFMKQSDGTWQKKSIYMKQLDKAWM